MQIESILIAIHVVAAIAITGLVLIQRGKGAEIGASFGSGASQTMFGTLGSGNFLTKSTTLMTVVFFATSLGLAIMARERAELAVQNSGLLSGDIEQVQQPAPAPVQQETAPQGDVPQAGEAAPQGDVPQAGETAPQGDLPVVEQPAGDVPAAPEQPE